MSLSTPILTGAFCAAATLPRNPQTTTEAASLARMTSSQTRHSARVSAVPPTCFDFRVLGGHVWQYGAFGRGAATPAYPVTSIRKFSITVLARSFSAAL